MINHPVTFLSLLLSQDPVNKGDKVILVYSLVPGGVAEVSGKLQVGDKLVSVGGVSVVNHSLQFAVQQLMNVQVRYASRNVLLNLGFSYRGKVAY